MQVMFTSESRIVLYNERVVIAVGGLLNVSTYGVQYKIGFVDQLMSGPTLLVYDGGPPTTNICI